MIYGSPIACSSQDSSDTTSPVEYRRSGVGHGKHWQAASSRLQYLGIILVICEGEAAGRWFLLVFEDDAGER